MKLVLLASRATIIRENNYRKDFLRNMEGQGNRIWYKKLEIDIFFLHSMKNNEKIIENGMIELRDENDVMKDDKRMAKNEEIG